jgi:hypothetical protein
VIEARGLLEGAGLLAGRNFGTNSEASSRLGEEALAHGSVAQLLTHR